jgi:hypothetical protein
MNERRSQKLCCRCGELKDLSEFTFKNLAKAILHSYCRACHAAWNREHYLRNKAAYIATARRNNARYDADNLRRLVDYLLCHPCVDCGEADVVVLEFDHRDRSTKRAAVGSILNNRSWLIVEAEIAKCDVRCANCHRRRTAQQRGWRKIALQVLLGRGGRI